VGFFTWVEDWLGGCVPGAAGAPGFFAWVEE
jgi:hypothetical protein